MMIIGCDFHPSWQQVAWVDTETGECGERKLVHAAEEAKMFYQQLQAPGTRPGRRPAPTPGDTSRAALDLAGSETRPQTYTLSFCYSWSYQTPQKASKKHSFTPRWLL